MRLSTLVLPVLFAASLSACKRHPAPAQDAPQAVAPTAAATVAPATTPPADAVAAPGAVKPFDLQSVPVTTKELPPFPYFSKPAELEDDKLRVVKDIAFDRVYVIAGEEFRPVEGRVMHRAFSLSNLKWSPLQAHRNYETALKALGATRVDKVSPAEDKFRERNGGTDVWRKMGDIPSLNRPQDADVPYFEQWVMRTPKTTIWLSFFLDNGSLGMLTVEEKAMQQSVTMAPAPAP